MSPLLDAEPRVVSAGVSLFADALTAQAVPVQAVDWRPPMEGTEDDLAVVMADSRRDAANRTAVGRMLAAGAELVDVRPAGEALGLAKGSFLHAGPPLAWERASGPMRGALIGAMMLEGLAADPDEAEQLLAGGGVELAPCHHHRAVGPMAGVVSPSMWMFELRDPEHGGTAYCSLNEGLGKVLRYGAYGPEVIDRLRWMSAVLGPLLRDAVRAHGPVDVKAIAAQMLQMGDEGHNRNRAGTLMFLRELLPSLIASGAPSGEVAEVARFVAGNDHFFLNLGMPACKLAADAARDVPGSTLVVAMARNGTDFGIQVSGTGDRWFTGPAQTPEGLYLGAFGPEDANPDIGDSAITETGGIGGFAMAAAPAIVRFVGGEVPDAIEATLLMYEITLAENPTYQIPVLDFRGSPTGIDVTRVVRTGILPHINT
ncbi:MAG TPA: DUF1116 domain-containing protein, partial [Candidatus Eisenbacteria bacterium]|nr:DUF1116 domain-containing protein [Candidatus Eisenbacteria bacterium]